MVISLTEAAISWKRKWICKPLSGSYKISSSYKKYITDGVLNATCFNNIVINLENEGIHIVYFL